MYDESPGFFKKWLRIIVIQDHIETANVSVHLNKLVNALLCNFNANLTSENKNDYFYILKENIVYLINLL